VGEGGSHWEVGETCKVGSGAAHGARLAWVGFGGTAGGWVIRVRSSKRGGGRVVCALWGGV